MAKKKRIVKDRQTREDEIKLAARKVFVKKGFVASTIEEIARQAKVAPGTIYRYYDNKDDLYTSLMVPSTIEIGDGLVPLESEIDQGKITSGRDIITRILDIYYRIYQKSPDEFLMFATIQSGFFSKISPRNLQRVNEAARRNFAVTRRIIAKGKKQGLIRPSVSEPVMADALWSIFLGLIVVEENKKRITGKDHVCATLTETFSLLAEAISFDLPGR